MIYAWFFLWSSNSWVLPQLHDLLHFYVLIIYPERKGNWQKIERNENTASHTTPKQCKSISNSIQSVNTVFIRQFRVTLASNYFGITTIRFRIKKQSKHELKETYTEMRTHSPILTIMINGKNSDLVY